MSENLVQIQVNITLFLWAFGQDHTSVQNLRKQKKEECQCNVVNSGNTVQLQNLEITATNQVCSLLMIDKRNFMLWNSTLKVDTVTDM